jgi:hypothetical protein
LYTFGTSRYRKGFFPNNVTANQNESFMSSHEEDRAGNRRHEDGKFVKGMVNQRDEKNKINRKLERSKDAAKTPLYEMRCPTFSPSINDESRESSTHHNIHTSYTSAITVRLFSGTTTQFTARKLDII